MEASNKHMESTWNIFTLDRKKEFYIAFFSQGGNMLAKSRRNSRF